MVIRKYPGLKNPPKSKAEMLVWMAPLLRTLHSKGGQARPREVYEELANFFNLSTEERETTNKRGVVRYENQIAWARSYLVKTGYLDGSIQGVWKLTEKGKNTELDGPILDEIYKSVARLNSIKRTGKNTKNKSVKYAAPEDEENTIAPSATSSAYSDHQQVLISLIKQIEPENFEEFCSKLLYISGVEDVKTTRYSKDGGIDGTGRLRTNEFVTISIAFQAKRLTTKKVSSAEVQSFRGAIGGGYEKGVFFTTTSFSSDAKIEARKSGVTEIELIDMDRIIEICEKHMIGLTEQKILVPDLEFFTRYQKTNS
ncbi:MAG: restriction endonuclease [Magnetovibrio sp.]|nr:restriction endonuclease [Magnetovibrio sp.]